MQVENEYIMNLAKYATDSYFANMDENSKRNLMSDRSSFFAQYKVAFEEAVHVMTKSKELEPFGNDNEKQFK